MSDRSIVEAFFMPLARVNSQKEEKKINYENGKIGPSLKWVLDSDNDYSLLNLSNNNFEHLPPGYYTVFSVDGTIYFKQKEIKTDTLTELSDTVMEQVIEEFDEFWQLHDEFKSRGFLHKRGILLHGKPGTGKTVSVTLMARKMIEQGGIIIEVSHPGLASAAFRKIREKEPDRPIIAVLEDFELILREYGEHGFLSMLDGENQVDRIVYLATTNHLDQIHNRFKNRPSRFDIVREINSLSPGARKNYLLYKDDSIENVDDWVDKTNGWGIAQLKELIILVQCFKHELDFAVDRINKMSNAND